MPHGVPTQEGHAIPTQEGHAIPVVTEALPSPSSCPAGWLSPEGPAPPWPATPVPPSPGAVPLPGQAQGGGVFGKGRSPGLDVVSPVPISHSPQRRCPLSELLPEDLGRSSLIKRLIVLPALPVMLLLSGTLLSPVPAQPGAQEAPQSGCLLHGRGGQASGR